MKLGKFFKLLNADFEKIEYGEFVIFDSEKKFYFNTRFEIPDNLFDRKIKSWECGNFEGYVRITIYLK